MKRVALLSLLLVSVLVFTSGCALWKFGTGAVEGVAYDQLGAALGNRAIDVYLVGQKQTVDLKTDADGKFAIDGLRAGNYILKMQGGGVLGEAAVNVRVGETASVELEALVVVPVKVQVVDVDGKAYAGAQLSISGMSQTFNLGTAVTTIEVPIGSRTFAASALYGALTAQTSRELGREGLGDEVLKVTLPIRQDLNVTFDKLADLTDNFTLATGVMPQPSRIAANLGFDSTSVVVKNGYVQDEKLVTSWGGAYLRTKKSYGDVVVIAKLKTIDPAASQLSSRIFIHEIGTALGTGWGINQGRTAWQSTQWGFDAAGNHWRTWPASFGSMVVDKHVASADEVEVVAILDGDKVAYYRNGALIWEGSRAASWVVSDVGPMPTSGTIGITLNNQYTVLDQVTILPIVR